MGSKSPGASCNIRKSQYALFIGMPHEKTRYQTCNLSFKGDRETMKLNLTFETFY